MKTYLKIGLLALFLFGSCTEASEDDLSGGGGGQQLPDPVTYQAHVKPIIDNNCLGCHSDPPVNGAPNSLTEYADVWDAVANEGLIGRISLNPGQNGFMPLGGSKLSQFEIDTIIEWENDGFQIN